MKKAVYLTGVISIMLIAIAKMSVWGGCTCLLCIKLFYLFGGLFALVFIPLLAIYLYKKDT
jgi:hypothetical protein